MKRKYLYLSLTVILSIFAVGSGLIFCWYESQKKEIVKISNSIDETVEKSRNSSKAFDEALKEVIPWKPLGVENDARPSSYPSSNGRRLLGIGPTGYTLSQGSDGCIYVTNLTQGDLNRMRVSIRGLKR